MPLMRINTGLVISVATGFSMILCTGCGNQAGYVVETEQWCHKLSVVKDRGDALRWATEQITLHGVSAKERPCKVLITNLPAWLSEVSHAAAPPTVNICYDVDPEKDYVMFTWLSGRGAEGFAVGKTNCMLSMDPALFYVLKCQPGLFAWHSRRDY